MKAIVCKYLPATNTKPSRIKASAEGVKSVTVSYDYTTNPFRAAAIELCGKYDWSCNLIEGGLPNGDRVFVFAPQTK